ncbi:transporter substrate-binding domain-containing protein [Vibrio sp. JPW-9-11-11]|uniref:substrate-binding periplasmic protein n=1 Tax=Vibrio sp. JPW-9-11-11 TaxID=1416532 RepID=UPI001593AA31|nr:transporter substrate-binding domain-containing protein [Vibrio sp. JPW-9-11-11]NVD08874.1 transporter substrate-binding domain-containing protein [Vibrio sp. JPW-9-11-11]
MPCFIHKLILLLALVISAGASSHTFDDIPHLKVCGDIIDWRPYTYLEDEQAKGFDVEVLERVLGLHGISYEFVMTSWSRCLKGTKNGNYDLSVSASYSENREQDYLYTEWYYTITPYYLFSTRHFPDGLAITESSDLENYKVCGNHNYNYADFGLNHIDASAHTIQQSLDQLETGECDVYLSWAEILTGNKDPRGDSLIGDEIMSMAVPNMAPHKFYMLISRQLDSADTLKNLLDEQFRKLRESH